jgi:urease accessory protein UreH
MNHVTARLGQEVAAQRAKGRLGLRFRVAAGRTRVHAFFQEGCLKARLPRPLEPAVCDAVTMNISGEARAMASLILAGPGSAEKLPDLRAALGGMQAGASCFGGIVFARILAADGAALRRGLVAALAVAREGRSLPGVWQG